MKIRKTKGAQKKEKKEMRERERERERERGVAEKWLV